MNKDNQKQYFETALILNAIIDCGILICYIDEYHFSEQDIQLYNWVPKGKDEFLYN